MKDEPIRVVMVVEKLHGLGGAQKQALRLCRALRAHGVEARIVTGRWRRVEPPVGEVEGISVRALFTALKMFHMKGLRWLGHYIYLVSLLLHLFAHRRKYDVIHVHSATTSALGVALAGRWFKKPTVMKVMASGGWSDFKRMRGGHEIPGASRWMGLLQSMDRVICLNKEAEAECEAEGFPPQKRISIPNGFPVKEVTPLKEYPDRETVEVSFVGRLDAQKNPRLLMEALAIVARSPEGSRVRARFLGSGPQRAELEARVRELGLADRVKLLGRVENVPEHLRATDIFVLPSLSEGVSNALLESMAYGIPCVATDIPGNVDLILDGLTGLLVTPGDTEGLASAIRELVGDRVLRESLGRAGRNYVETHFDIDVTAERYARLYRALLGPPDDFSFRALKDGGPR